MSARLAAPAAVTGATLWLALWVHFVAAHGFDQSDDERTVLGLTHYDSAKLLVVCAILFAIAVSGARPRSRPAAAGRAVAIGALAALAVGAALAFWPAPWGSYEFDQSGGVTAAGGAVAAVSTFALTAGLVVLGAAERGPWIALGFLAFTIVPFLHETPIGGLFALGWFAVARSLARDTRGEEDAAA